MPLYTKESLETLRHRVDLADLVGGYVELKRTGAAYKGLCPFHDEKTPSFTIQKGDSHYHCFGCGAHGDAIQFLIDHQRMAFSEAVESLGQRFGVALQIIEDAREHTGPSKADIKAALDQASRFFHFLLLHTEDGREALEYLYRRGLTLEFIRQFEIGFAPNTAGMLRKILHAKGINDELMVAAGLIAVREQGGFRDFFSDRITFPIRDASGAVIGFSARKFKEETFGGKYVNTSETTVFKKSRVLFGLNYSRRRIAKEHTAIIVEGQLDALRLIYSGLNLVVAGQGTAFGDGHVRELLQLGVKRVFLALDADKAGQEAARKIGHLFQKEGVEVKIVPLPTGDDPDSMVRNRGIDAFVALLDKSIDYLAFLVQILSKGRDTSPAAKAQLVQEVVSQVRQWNDPVMVHESLKRLSQLTGVPEEIVGVGQHTTPNYFVRSSASAGLLQIDPDRILESDLLRWLLVSGERSAAFAQMVRTHLSPSDMRVDICRRLYERVLQDADEGRRVDFLSLAAELGDAECQQLLDDIMRKKVNRDKAQEHLEETVQKIMDRNWMQRREAIRMKIQSGQCSDDEAFALLKQFDDLKRSPPKVEIAAVAGV